MDDKVLNAAVGKFVKTISFNVQREIEKSVRKALATGALKGHETFTAGATLTSEKLGLNVTIYSKIEL